MKKFQSSRLFALASVLAIATGCEGRIAESESGDGANPATPPPPGDKDPTDKPDVVKPPPPPPFTAQPPEAYLPKLKDLLTGLPITSAELDRVKADPAALRDLLETWRGLPAYRAKLQQWLGQAFQQVQVDRDEFADQLGFDPSNVFGNDNRARIEKLITETFARTAMALIDEGRPFTETVTTNRFMLNPPMMALLAFLDARPLDDKRKKTQNAWFSQKYPNFQMIATRAGIKGAPPPAVAADAYTEGNAAFMKFKFVPGSDRLPCSDTPYVSTGGRGLEEAFATLFGHTTFCAGLMQPVFTEEDWNQFRMVTIRPPAEGENPDVFWNVNKFRRTAELVVGTPRVGFMTTLAFFANWATNDSNVFRVTANQTLITALGLSFQPEGPGIPIDDSNLEGEHAAKGTVCYGCHVTLDPMRDFFRHDYTLYYAKRFDQLDPTKNIPATGTFSADDSMPIQGQGITALAQALAQHPRFAFAWALKLCQYANAGVCEPDDPELLRVATVFKASGHNFSTLVRELFSSPITTFAARTLTGEKHDAIVALARREIFCDRLGVRLGLTDVCNLEGKKSIGPNLSTLALGLPDAGYARGEVTAVMPREPNMFFVAAVEAICTKLSVDIVAGGRNTLWADTETERAINDFADKLMGLPDNDSLRPGIIDVLKRHHQAALETGASARDALRSTFIVACQSPLSLSLGL